MASRCRKFVPNLFNKTKCQSCFGAKESHTAEALESSKAARKISKCTYLFVSPDLDFSNPLQRTKRWQRRFFILYDDGELTYSVDDNPSTIPQGSVDMNKCTDVFHAEEKTGHEFSIGIVVPNKPTSYVKGTAKDEIQRWFDVLVMYPRSLTIKTKRSPGSKPGSPSPDETTEGVEYPPPGGGVSRHLSYFPTGTEKSVSDDEDADSVHSKDSGDTYERSGRTRGRYKQRDVRRSKSEVRPSDLRLAEDEYKKKTDGGFTPLSLPSSTGQGKFGRDKNLDGLPTRRAGEPETFSSVRSMKHRKAAKSQHAAEASKAPNALTTPTTSADAAATPTSSGAAGTDSASPLSRRLSMSNIPTSSKLPTSHTHKALGRAASASPAASATGGGVPALVYPPPTTSSGNSLTDANETDEHKIAKNEHARKSMEKSPIVRKGWLLVRQDIQTNVWSKHWFVLCGTSLSYYKDAKAEETNQVDGVIDVASAYEVSSVKAERNHGFRIKTKEGEYVLSAMTSGIRRNWIDAVESIIAEIRRTKEKTARQDMGFVFESPLRSPRTPTASAATAVPQPIVAPVVPDPTSRVNTTLREMAERRRETGDDRPLEDMYEVVAGSERKDSVCSDTEREVSALTSHQDGQSGAAATVFQHRHVSDVPPSQSPKSPSAFVSPSQRIKEKSRSKTPPRTRSPPPPASLAPTLTPAGGHHLASTSNSSTPVDRVLLLPTGNSSDENDESLTAKLLESQKQVQHLQQQVQDVNSSVRKQRVEIESLQTKLELTTSQLRDMETALTQSAQNLTKERKTTSRLNEALENYKREQTQSGGLQDRSAMLERQIKEATQKLAAQEVKMSMVGNLEEQLQIRTSKLATLEKVLGNTRRHLQDAVENLRETELHYQTKIEEMEHDFEEERVELHDKLHQMEERLNKVVTESNNTVNSDLSTQLMKERAQSMQRLEELVKEQKGKIDQLTEGNETARQQIDELQCFKDRAAVNQNQLDNVQQEYNSLQTAFLSMRHDLESVANELEVKDNELISRNQENSRLSILVEELQEKCKATHPQVAADVYTNQQVESITQDLKAALESSKAEIAELRQTHAQLAQRLESSNVTVQSLSEKCKKAEMELAVERNKQPIVAPSPPPVSGSSSNAGGFTLGQLVDLISAVARSCERMTESAVAMLAGEMIETDIKSTINFSQQQRGLLGNSTVDQLSKKFSGMRQRLNYIVKHSVAKGQFDKLVSEKESLSQELAAVQRNGGAVIKDVPTPKGSDSDYLTALLERCRAEILCISSDITRLDISHVEARLHSLNTALQQLDEQKSANDFSTDSAIECYCNKLAIQASAMFEIARSVSDGVDLSQILTSVENCLQATSGLVTNVEDLSLRNYALLISERLLLSYELGNLIEKGKWKCFDEEHSPDFATKALVVETLQRIDMYSMTKGQPLGEAFLNCCLNNLLQRNISGSESLVLLKNETALVGSLVRTVDESLVCCIKGYVSHYTSELVNFGAVEMGEVEALSTRLTGHLCTRIKRLASAGSLGDLCTRWLHDQLCSACEKVKGLDPKEPPVDLGDLALKLSMYETKMNAFSSLMMKHKTSTLSQSLVSEASKLAGLSAELAKRAASPGSTEAKIASLAQRLERTDRLLSAYSSRYSDSVQQVMREVVHSMQMNLLRYQLGVGEYPLSPVEQSLTLQVSSLSLQLQQANQRSDQLVNISQHEKAVEALHDEMSLLKVEHSTELDESKRDMKMVLKSVKAEEYRLATELTQQISALKSQLADEQRAHQAARKKLEDSIPGTVPLEEHVQLKDKVRDLENCLHEMQEEFEEELYQERRAHLAELDKVRAELLEVISQCDNQQLSAEGVHDRYNDVINKLKAEQTSLQQWIDDIREAHKDEIDALQHERDAALADEVMTAQSALEAAQSAHTIEMEQMKSKVAELEQKAVRLLEVERDLLLHKRESDIKEERISALDSKLLSLNKKAAKLELNATKSHESIDELTALNRQLTERNSQLVGKFTEEIGKIGSKSSPHADGLHTALKAQVDTLTEKLRLEQLTRSRLEDKMEALKDSYEQRLQQRTDDAKLDVSVSPAEEMLLRRKIGEARSPSPHMRHSSPTALASSASSPTSNNTNMHAPADSQSSAIGSSRRLADKSYDINRSKSATSLSKQSKISRSKRLSNPDDASRPIMLDTNDRGFQRYQKSGGMSIADRMRKFK